MNEQIFNKALKLGIEANTFFLLKEWNLELIKKYEHKQEEFDNFIKKHEELN